MDVGVRAEPRLLRDVSSLEYLYSGLNWVSHYLASNLQNRQSSQNSFFEQHNPEFRKSTSNHYILQQGNNRNAAIEQLLPDDREMVTFSTFQDNPLSSSGVFSFLLLGYQNGFQVWDVTNPENVHETCSIRDESMGTVQFMHILASPEIYDADGNCEADPYVDVRPLVAVVSSMSSPCDYSKNNKHNSVTRLRIFSLRTHQMVKDFTEFVEQGISVVNVQSSSCTIVLGCTNEQQASLLHILSSLNLSLKSNPLTDVCSHPSATGPVFTVGSRYIAYSSAVTDTDRSTTNGFLTHIVKEKDLTGAAKDIAKEVVNSVKSLSEYGYHSISNYFVAQSNESSASSTATMLQHKINDYSPPSNSISNSKKKDNGTRNRLKSSATNIGAGASFSLGVGSIMIRDLQKLQSVYVHFQAHNSQLQITQLAFDPSGTLLLSTTSQGHIFHVFSLVSSQGVGRISEPPITHLYSLSRGITDAQVDDIRFSTDSLWCAVSTARGTTHLYPINPYGGEAEIPGHVQAKVINPKHYPHSLHRHSASSLKATSLNSIIRIKQRRTMDLEENDKQNATNNCGLQPSISSGISSSSSSTSTSSFESCQHQYSSNSDKAKQQLSCGKLAAHFLPRSKIPYLLGDSGLISEKVSSTWPSSWKTQVSKLLKNKNSAADERANKISSLKSYISYDQWKTADDNRNRDNRIFGFDEEQERHDYYRNSNENSSLHSTIDSSATTISASYQDMYSVHPGGILTLHRCWLTQTLVKRRENGRVVEKLELNVKGGDVAEWKVARKPDWGQVKMNYNVNKKKTKQHQQRTVLSSGGANSGNCWLSYAEITTYDSQFEKPLWSRYHSHISFHTFIIDTRGEETVPNNDGCDSSTFREEKSGSDDQEFVPPTKPLAIIQDAPEPYTSRVSRVGRTSIAPKDGALLDDALAELEENISSAMTSSFSPPSSKYLGTSNGSLAYRHLATSTGNATSSSASSTFHTRDPITMITEDISFEDACLINPGHTQRQEDDCHPNDIKDSNNDTTKLSTSNVEVRLSDGDNVTAFPQDSVISADDDDSSFCTDTSFSGKGSC